MVLAYHMTAHTSRASNTIVAAVTFTLTNITISIRYRMATIQSAGYGTLFNAYSEYLIDMVASQLRYLYHDDFY